MGYLYANTAAPNAVLSFTPNGGSATVIPPTGSAVYSQTYFTGGTFTASF